MREREGEREGEREIEKEREGGGEKEVRWREGGRVKKREKMLECRME